MDGIVYIYIVSHHREKLQQIFESFKIMLVRKKGEEPHKTQQQQKSE